MLSMRSKLRSPSYLRSTPGVWKTIQIPALPRWKQRDNPALPPLVEDCQVSLAWGSEVFSLVAKLLSVII